MIIASDHATVYAGVVVADHAQQVVLLSMAGPRTAVKAIYAALRSNHRPWLKLYGESGVEPVAVVRGVEPGKPVRLLDPCVGEGEALAALAKALLALSLSKGAQQGARVETWDWSTRVGGSGIVDGWWSRRYGPADPSTWLGARRPALSAPST